MAYQNIAIVGSVPVKNLPLFEKLLEKTDFIIAANGGAKNILATNQTPDILIGDSDSANLEAIKKDQHLDGQLLIYPKEKDQSDGELALKKAIEMKPKTISLFGMVSPHLGHTLCNIALLYQVPVGIHAELFDLNAPSPIRIFMIRDGEEEKILPLETEEVEENFSFVCLERTGAVVSVQNALYSMHQEKLLPSSRGLSNRSSSEGTTIKVHQGCVLCVVGTHS